ncbi:MAG: TetR/AcrR family transcriptional regulator, partial [Butyrivibrio sp.]|nr:TetR/AcrR family transcriptional regulator [Butyrivibrio sp.]
MYKVSSDRRFQKNKREIRKAYIKLVQEKGYQNVTISDIAQEADINRMTFYSHYDIVEDIFVEFVDEMESQIMSEISGKNRFDLDDFFELLNSLM